MHRRQYEKVLGYIDVAREEGLRLVTGGSPPEGPDFSAGFYKPTLYDDVPPDSRLLREEIFGPVLVVLPFSNYDEAVRISNEVAFGLTASVFTRDLANAHAYARDVEAGYVWVNDVSMHFAGTPYGGVKDSGLGREESLEEILSYTQTKNVNVLFGAPGPN